MPQKNQLKSKYQISMKKLQEIHKNKQSTKKLQATVTLSREKKKKNSSQYKWILRSHIGFNKQGFQRDDYKYIQRFVANVKTLKRKWHKKGESP